MVLTAACNNVTRASYLEQRGSSLPTFVVDSQVVLRQTDVGVLVLGAPGAGQRRLSLGHFGVETDQFFNLWFGN